MSVEELGAVVATVLRRSSAEGMSGRSLRAFCLRLYTEHLLPASGLGEESLPSELKTADALHAYLHAWHPGTIAVSAAVDGEWSARLVDALASAPPPSAPVAQPAATGIRPATPLDPPAHAPPQAQHDEIQHVRQLLCTTLLDYVLQARGALHHNVAAPLEEVRTHCIQLLVRLQVPATYALASSCRDALARRLACLSLGVMHWQRSCGGSRRARLTDLTART